MLAFDSNQPTATGNRGYYHDHYPIHNVNEVGGGL